VYLTLISGFLKMFTEVIMGLFNKLNLGDVSTIDWEMTPEYSFGTFESWGGKERVRSGRERIYYFFIDNWGDTPRLCLMERGIKHARIVAEILAPDDMLKACVKDQGKAVFDKNYAINQQLKNWLLENILETDDETKIIPLAGESAEEIRETGLPDRNQPLPELDQVHLPSEQMEVDVEAVAALVKKYNMYDMEHNSGGECLGYLVDNGDALTVTDMVTGIMWQRGGIDIMSHRMMAKEIERLNNEKLAGYDDWRQPTIIEALSLMRREKNDKGVYNHSCFSEHQPFIFVKATRNPGGYWFVDFRQARTFWASGTIPGAFGRLCRQIS